jgi:thioredoxin 1
VPNFKAMYSNEIESIEQAEKIIEANLGVLVYFYNDNCAPCISLRPKVVELVNSSYPDLKMYFVNSANKTEIAAYFNSFSNPTLILFFDGKEHRRFSKYIAIQQLSEEIQKPYSILFEN